MIWYEYIIPALIGFFAAVIGFVAMEFWVRPARAIQNEIYQIGGNIYFYSNVWRTERVNEARLAFRGHAQVLLTRMLQLGWRYRVLARLFGLPTKQKLVEGIRRLTGLSNHNPDEPHVATLTERVNEIREALGLADLLDAWGEIKKNLEE